MNCALMFAHIVLVFEYLATIRAKPLFHVLAMHDAQMLAEIVAQDFFATLGTRHMGACKL
jgi:hypothetical protein